MFFSYFDETGDDGFPVFASPLFVLTSIYFDHLDWHGNYQKCFDFRKDLKRDFGFPFKFEFHTKLILLNKKPYSALQYDDKTRIELINRHIQFISKLNIQVINVAINKKLIRSINYSVLDKALTYSIQRIENSLSCYANKPHFIIITDSGRVSKMRTTSRRIQKYNPITSNFGGKYQKQIKLLIEDPLPKDSEESFFIQIADTISMVIYDYILLKKTIGELHNRVPKEYGIECIENWLKVLKPVLNVNASKNNEFGIVCYPLK